ncbi:bifunctional nicotinamidase/pyrazinamidase [Acidocella sp.]|uniref:bifunctional nicotinamidase/pyrazinamidase n=1 Tax=Acidocella sp. TaxID=50710 RepID=UPI003D08FCBD
MQKHTALIVVDLQPDFCPGGALAVPDGDSIVPLVNELGQSFETVVLTQDWHPAAHVSFAANHPGKAPFDSIDLPYGRQVLWPTHCVMDSPGAALHPGLNIPHASLIIRKGSHKDVDSYSAFLEADRATRTGLDGYLASRGITDLYICGLALDFCVAWTAEDARRFGFAAAIIEDAARAINLDGSLAAAWTGLEKAGVRRLHSSDIFSHA